MTTTLTIQTLIQHFEEKLHQIDRENLGSIVGKEPQFPQLVIYLGEDAMEAHGAVSAGLLQTWPQYEQELKFLGVTKSAEGTPAFSQLLCGGQDRQAMDEEAVGKLVTSLFGTKMHFRDRSNLLVYYILDTTSFRSAEELNAWLPVIGQIKAVLGTQVLDLLTVLLNENISRQKVAAQIRNCLSDFYNKGPVRQAVRNVLLLSNWRSDNAILEDWEVCYKLLCSLITLSNNADAQVATSIFCNAVITASFSREEKPLRQIGQVVACNLLDRLEEMDGSAKPGKLKDDPRLSEKLGLTKNGTFAMLDAYAESSLFGLLPGAEQLEVFPRRDDREMGPLSAMSAKAFNEYTLGAWDQHLTSIAKGVQEKISMDSAVRQRWSEEYQKILLEAFNKDEILYLASHLADVKALFSKARVPSQDVPVLNAAREQLKYLLSTNEELIGLFLDAIALQGEQVKAFAQAWSTLLKSRRQLHEIRDSNIATFYERKIQNYCDHHGLEMQSQFLAIHDMEQLAQFLRGTLDRVIDSDEVFSAAFEDELEGRLSEDALPTDAKQYIRKKLTGDQVYTYLQTDFDLGEPLVSAILLKVGTPLYKNLYSNLSPTTYYYNTGSSSAAEALVVYQVSAKNLVNGEGM